MLHISISVSGTDKHVLILCLGEKIINTSLIATFPRSCAKLIDYKINWFKWLQLVKLFTFHGIIFFYKNVLINNRIFSQKSLMEKLLATLKNIYNEHLQKKKIAVGCHCHTSKSIWLLHNSVLKGCTKEPTKNPEPELQSSLFEANNELMS